MTTEVKVVWPAPGNTVETKLGMQYIIGQPINSGGYALVFEGHDLFGNAIALKVFKPASRPFEEVRIQWERECHIFEKLRHTNVVAIYDAFICDNLFYIVLERAWGSLYDWIQDIESSEQLVREIARQLLFAIHSIHTHDVIHRDITIYNILVFHGYQNAIFKISDFGISEEFLDPWVPKISRSLIAHPYFIPPEILMPQYGYTNKQSDLYHLGLVLLYSLTKRLPFDESMSREEIQQTVINGVPRLQAEQIGTNLGDFIAILLRRHMDYRFHTAIEAWMHLKQL